MEPIVRIADPLIDDSPLPMLIRVRYVMQIIPSKRKIEFFIDISFAYGSNTMSKRHYLFLCFIYYGLNSYANQPKSDTASVWFPEQHVWPVMTLDPLECQPMGGSYFLFRNDSDPSLYSTVNLGLTKPVFASRGKKIQWEGNFGVAAFSQFDLIKQEDGSYLAGLMNIDFKLSADLVVRKNNNLVRLRTFHLSSHIGDDYALRHSDTISNDKSVNYEQVDLTYMRTSDKYYFYAGVGWIYTIHVFRERLSFQTGGMLNFRESKPLSYFAGTDIKILEENGYLPDARMAAGISFNHNSRPILRLWAEYYTGHLPYSTIDYGRVKWTGLAMAFYL